MTVSLVTGASTGIGLATALHLARRGHRVFAGLRNRGRGVLLEEAARREGLPVEIVPLDVVDDASVDSAVRDVLARGNGLDVLVNNAGLSGAAPLEDTADADHRAIFETNYWGVVRMMRAVLPHMRERRSGAIVNLSSIAGRIAVPNQAAYSASKHAVEAASEVLASEVQAFGVRVAIVEPGVFATQIWENSEEATLRDKGSPYRQIMRWNTKMYACLLNQAGDPQRVAETIERAIVADTPKLRWVVGDDAEAMIHHRGLASDEEFLELGADLTDAKRSDLYRRLLGIDVR